MRRFPCESTREREDIDLTSALRGCQTSLALERASSRPRLRRGPLSCEQSGIRRLSRRSAHRAKADLLESSTREDRLWTSYIERVGCASRSQSSRSAYP